MIQLNSSEIVPADFQDDDIFDAHFSSKIQKLSKVHWSPLAVIKSAAAFLTPEKGCKIIDIGSGVGKFCIAGAYFQPTAQFYGIEQRENLHLSALRSKVAKGLQNVHFMHGNFTQLNLQDYSGIYFFNSFAENLYNFGRIDHTIEHSSSLYNYYATYLYKVLEEKQKGTRLATYHVSQNEIPDSFKLTHTEFENNLKMWIKH